MISEGQVLPVGASSFRHLVVFSGGMPLGCTQPTVGGMVFPLGSVCFCADQTQFHGAACFMGLHASWDCTFSAFAYHLGLHASCSWASMLPGLHTSWCCLPPRVEFSLGCMLMRLHVSRASMSMAWGKFSGCKRPELRCLLGITGLLAAPRSGQDAWVRPKLACCWIRFCLCLHAAQVRIILPGCVWSPVPFAAPSCATQGAPCSRWVCEHVGMWVCECVGACG